jgi:hypothetical protein
MRALRAMWSAMPEHLPGRIFVLSALWRLRALWRYRVLGRLYLHRLGSPMSRFRFGQDSPYLVKRASM